MKLEIRGLSLTRPWPWAFVNGPRETRKRVENRSKKPPAALVGHYVALHAAQSWDEGDREFISHVMGLPVPGKAEHPHSEIFAVAKLVGYVESKSDARLVGFQSNWFMGPYGWLFEELTQIFPVPCKGALGLWRLGEDVLDQVRFEYRASIGALVA